MDLSTIPGTGDLNLQLDPSTAEGSIKYQELADFAESQLNPEVTLSQQSPHTHIGTAVINTLTNQKEVLLSVTGGSENSTLTKEELLAGPTANAQLVLQLPAKTGETQPRNIYLGENSDTQALTDHFLRASHSPGGSSSTTSLPAESRPENQGDFSRTFETSARSGQSGLLNIRSIGSTPSAQDNQTETVVAPQSSPGGSTPRTQEEYGQRLSTGTSSYTSQSTKQLSTNNQNIQTSLTDLDYLNQQIARAREEGEQNLKETLNKLQSDLDQKLKDKEASLKSRFEEKCKQLELEQIEQEITFETQLHKETEDRKRAVVEANQQELDLFIQAQQAQILTIKNDFNQQQLQLEEGLKAIQTNRAQLEKDETVLQDRIAKLHKEQEEIDLRVKAQLEKDHKLRKRAIFEDFEKKISEYEEELDQKLEEEQENLREEYKQYAQSESKRLLKERDQQIKEFSDKIADQKKAYTSSLERKLEEYRQA